MTRIDESYATISLATATLSEEAVPAFRNRACNWNSKISASRMKAEIRDTPLRSTTGMIRKHAWCVCDLRRTSCPNFDAISDATNRTSDGQNDNSWTELIWLHASDTYTKDDISTNSQGAHPQKNLLYWKNKPPEEIGHMGLFPTCPVGLFETKTPNAVVPYGWKICAVPQNGPFQGVVLLLCSPSLRFPANKMCEVVGLVCLSPSCGPIPGLWWAAVTAAHIVQIFSAASKVLAFGQLHYF